MWDNGNKFDADVAYAMRIVQQGYASVEQAAAMCGLEAAALRARLSDGPPASADTAEKDKFFARLDR